MGKQEKVLGRFTNFCPTCKCYTAQDHPQPCEGTMPRLEHVYVEPELNEEPTLYVDPEILELKRAWNLEDLFEVETNEA